MDYKNFIENVKADLPDRLTGDLESAVVEEIHISKLQGRSYDGISIAPADTDMGMTMDMQPYFQLLADGVPYNQVLGQIADTLSERYEEKPDISVAAIENYAEVKELLTVQLVGQEGNEEILSQIPHREMEDMAVIYRLQLENDFNGSTSAVVTNAMLERYGVTVEQLHQDALENAAAHQPYEIKTMVEMLSESTGGLFIPEDSFPLYVATNESRINGASVLAYPDFMDNASERLKGSFYVLPSSIHEVILLPEDSALAVQELQAMVRDVNEAEVFPEERLSNNVYHYDSKARLFERADKYEDRMKAKERSRPSILDTLHAHQKESRQKPHKQSHSHRREEASL